MKSFWTIGLVFFLFSFGVAAHGVNVSGKTYIHCPERIHIPDHRAQIIPFIEDNLFSGSLTRLLLEQQKIRFKYQISKPGIYESVGGVLEFSGVGRVKSLKCEYFGSGGVDGDITITISSQAPYSVMSKEVLASNEAVDCLPISSDDYGGAEYIPCVIEPEFSLVVSRGPALDVIEQTIDGVRDIWKTYAVTVTKDGSVYYLFGSDPGEKKDVSSLCIHSEEKEVPLYIDASEHVLYELVIESYGKTNYLACFKNGQKVKAVPWREGSYDYANSKRQHQHQQKEKSHSRKTNHEWDKGSHRSGNGNKRRQYYRDPASGLKDGIASKIVYWFALFGMGDLAYHVVGGGPVEKAFSELGLPMHNADKATIKKRCRVIKKQHHPDKGGDAEIFNYYAEKCETLLEQ